MKITGNVGIGAEPEYQFPQKIKDNLLEEYGVNIPHMIGFK